MSRYVELISKVHLCQVEQEWDIHSMVLSCTDFLHVLGRPELLHLPSDILEKVAGCLELADVQSLGATCRLMRVLCGDACPGLRLSLYPHQVSISSQFPTFSEHALACVGCTSHTLF